MSRGQFFEGLIEDAHQLLLVEAKYGTSFLTLQWRHNERDDVSNHQPHDCLFNHLLRCRSKKTSKLRVAGLCAGKSPVTGEFPAQRASNAENVSIWWRHHEFKISPASHICPCHIVCDTLLYLRAESRFAPSQWETVLLCNDVYHWLGANLESALYLIGIYRESIVISYMWNTKAIKCVSRRSDAYMRQ